MGMGDWRIDRDSFICRTGVVATNGSAALSLSNGAGQENFLMDSEGEEQSGA